MTSPVRNDSRTIFGWAMYDWANSAYITAGSLVFAILFSDVIFPADGVSIAGISIGAEAFFAIVVGLGALLLFLAMPVLGAVADYTGAKKRLLRLFAYTGAAFAVLTALPGEGDLVVAVVLALVAQIGFAAGNVMYDGFLPEITTPDTVDHVSAKGFAFGYAGGGLHLVLSVVLLLSADQLGLGDETAERIVIASAGIWWAGFATFAFSRLRDAEKAATPPPGARGRFATYASIGFQRTWHTARHLLAFRQLALFLLAFLFYNDGVSTVIRITPVYATETLNLSAENIVGAFVVIQLVAFVGALGFGWLAGVLGTKGAILVSIAGWILVAVAGFLLPAEQPLGFLGLGALAGLVLGGVQALSRSLYASMIPEDASAEFFGFYSVFSKFSAIFGPLIFAAVGIATGSSRLAILFLAVFFVIGAVVLSLVDVEAGRAAKNQPRTFAS
ncbi:MAG: MFS transporter [Acidimicrobiia bacterium]|nr:MAG: MFS transporter [Acidimicrobiia bacterium]